MVQSLSRAALRAEGCSSCRPDCGRPSSLPPAGAAAPRDARARPSRRPAGRRPQFRAVVVIAAMTRPPSTHDRWTGDRRLTLASHGDNRTHGDDARDRPPFSRDAPVSGKGDPPAPASASRGRRPAGGHLPVERECLEVFNVTDPEDRARSEGESQQLPSLARDKPAGNVATFVLGALLCRPLRAAARQRRRPRAARCHPPAAVRPEGSAGQRLIGTCR